MEPNQETKVCTRCKRAKPMADFDKKGKILKQCLACRESGRVADRKRATTDKRKKWVEQYHQQEEVKLRYAKHNHIYHLEHVNEIRARKREYRAEHKDDIKLRKKAHYDANKVVIAIKKKEWRRKNWWYEHISNARYYDKKHGMYDKENFIDEKTFKRLSKAQKWHCIYCGHTMQLSTRIINHPRRLTVERIDNSMGHIKGNCLLACFRCNNRRGGKYDFYDFLDLLEEEGWGLKELFQDE